MPLSMLLAICSFAKETFSASVIFTVAPVILEPKLEYLILISLKNS